MKKIILSIMLVVSVVFGVAPNLVESVPSNGETDVNPNLRTIRLVFDQPMRTAGRSLCGGGPSFPETIGSKWIDDKTFEWTVKLKPNHEYAFSLNCPSSKKAFKSSTMQSVPYTPISFKTGNASDTTSAVSLDVTSLYKQALYAEKTEGDLDKAIGLYEQVVDAAKDIERVKAKAYLQMAQCYQKKGNDSEAIKYYKCIIDECGSQVNICKLATDKLSTLESDDISQVILTYPNVFGTISGLFVKAIGEAEIQGLPTNTCIFGIYPGMQWGRGGILLFENNTKYVINSEVQLGRFTFSDITVVNETGVPQKTRLVQDPTSSKHHILYWTPDMPIPPGGGRGLGYTINQYTKLMPNENGQYSVQLQNHYGPKVLETFILVVPKGTEIISSTEQYAEKIELPEADLYEWKKVVPNDQNHVIDVVLKDTASISSDATIYKDATGNLDMSILQDNDYILFDLVRPNGLSIGKQLWTADKDGKNWEIKSYLSMPNIFEQTTYVLTDDNYAPKKAITKNNMGEFNITYSDGKIESKSKSQGKDSIKTFEHAGPIFDNEQAMYILRLLPLDENAAYKFDIYPPQSGCISQCKIRVQGTEVVEGIKSYRIVLDVYANGSKLLTQYFWVSMDSRRLITKVDASHLLLNLVEFGTKKFEGTDEDIIKSLNGSNPSKKTDELEAEDLSASGWRKFMKGDPSGAEADFQKAVELDPTNDRNWQGLGWAQRNQMKNLNAKKSFEKCIKLNPKNTAALNGLGQIAKMDGDQELAAKYWRQAIVADRNNSSGAMFGLAQMYSESENYKDALKCYRMAIELEPNNQMIKDSLAQAEKAYRDEK